VLPALPALPEAEYVVRGTGREASVRLLGPTDVTLVESNR
jgi:hypothetical protein